MKKPELSQGIWCSPIQRLGTSINFIFISPELKTTVVYTVIS